MKKILKLIFLFVSFLSLEMFANVGKVVALNGQAQALREDSSISLKLGMAIEKNDVIVTGNKSKIQIIFNDETIVTIGKNSRFIVNSYSFEDKKKANADFKFLKGSFKLITGKIGKINPKAYKLQTKTASMGVRGTEIDMQLSDTKEFIKCTQGAIDVTILTTGVTQLLKSGESISINIKKSQNVNKTSDSSSSSNSTTETKTDTKYDSWISENNSVRKAVNDSFEKGHKQGYDLTSIEGRINRNKAGYENYDTSNVSITNTSTYDMTIDFGKGRNVNSVEIGDLKITISGDVNTVSNIQGKINDDNEIELTYDTTTPSVSDISVNGTMEFKNTDLDVQGQNLTGLKTTAQDEEVEINDIQFEAK